MLEDWSCHWVVYLMPLECSSLFSLSCFGMSSMHALLVWLELCISSWAFFCSEWLYIENWIGPDLSFDCLSVGNTHGAPRNLTLARTLIEWTSSFFFLKAIMVIFRQVCWEMMTVLLPWGRHDNLRNLFLRKHKSARRIFVYWWCWKRLVMWLGGFF